MRAARWPGTGAGASGHARGRRAGCGGRHHGQQSVRVRHEGGDDCARPDPGRRDRRGGGRRHGVHEQRAVSAEEGAGGLSLRP
ncbi:hypothetical protein G6F50_017776 [Rhizopus delemar]|uniref:Uncharacterized protein n=1 Tax=Rhizopus delemar TaxID=936053 RepID=A0A9P6XP35_9FUNG|nr:hypothetical protein G6F50_017776 [Rhizopus delemar]